MSRPNHDQAVAKAVLRLFDCGSDEQIQQYLDRETAAVQAGWTDAIREARLVGHTPPLDVTRLHLSPSKPRPAEY